MYIKLLKRSFYVCCCCKLLRSELDWIRWESCTEHVQQEPCMAVTFTLTERLQLFPTVPGCKNERCGSTVSSYDSSVLIKLPTLRCRTEPRVSSPRSFKNVFISSSAFPNRAPHYVSSFPALPPVTSLWLCLQGTWPSTWSPRPTVRSAWRWGCQPGRWRTRTQRTLVRSSAGWLNVQTPWLASLAERSAGLRGGWCCYADQ